MCEIIQFTAVPEKRMSFVNSLAVSRFKVVKLIATEPFALVSS